MVFSSLWSNILPPQSFPFRASYVFCAEQRGPSSTEPRIVTTKDCAQSPMSGGEGRGSTAYDER